MTTDVAFVRRQDRLEAAVDVMLDRGVRHVPVVAEDGRLVGLVSQGDLLAKGSVRRPIEEIMAAPLTVAPETPIAEVARILREHEDGCVPVVEDGRLLGIVTDADFVSAFAAGDEAPPEEGASAEAGTEH